MDPQNPERTNYVQLQDQRTGPYNSAPQQGYPQFNQPYNQLPQYPNPAQYPNVPAQYPNYPQYPPQQNQGPNFGFPGQPVQPVQPIQPVQPVPAQIYLINGAPGNLANKQQIIEEIRVLDDRLDHGCYKWYIIWLYFVAIMGVLDFIQTFIYAINYAQASGYISGFLCAFWLVYQSLLEINAIQKKDPAKASRALSWMTIFAIFNIATIIILSLWLGSFSDDYYPIYDDGYLLIQAYLITLISIYGLCLFSHLFITLLGAFKVFKILKHRQILQNVLRNLQ